jgi:hypothetical protein
MSGGDLGRECASNRRRRRAGAAANGGEWLQPRPWRSAASRGRRRGHRLAQPLEGGDVDECRDRRAQRRELRQRIQRQKAQRIR